MSSTIAELLKLEAEKKKFTLNNLPSTIEVSGRPQKMVKRAMWTACRPQKATGIAKTQLDMTIASGSILSEVWTSFLKRQYLKYKCR